MKLSSRKAKQVVSIAGAILLLQVVCPYTNIQTVALPATDTISNETTPQLDFTDTELTAFQSPSLTNALPQLDFTDKDIEAPNPIPQADSPTLSLTEPASTSPFTAQLVAAVTESSTANTSKIEELTRQILLKCVELERYSLNYRQNVARQGRWKGWRYFVSQEGNNLTCMSGYIIGVAMRAGNFTTPEHLVRKTMEDYNAIVMAGQIIGASGSFIEMSINAYHDMEARAHGYSPAAARKKVLGLRNNIDSLLLQRNQLVNQLLSTDDSSKYIAVARAEEQVLLDIRDISLSEFVQFHTNARRLLAFQQSLYMFDICRNVTGAIASRWAWSSLRYDDRHANLDSGIFGIISGMLTILGPIVSREIGWGIGKYEKHYVKAVTAGTKHADSSTLEKDLATLKQVASDQYLENSNLPLLRCALYNEHTAGVKKQVALSSQEIRSGYLAAAENVGAGAFIGSLKVTGGILFTIAGIHYRRSARHTNVMLGTANILGVVATGFGAFDNLRIQVKGEMVRHKLGKQGLLAGQIIKDRLAKLDNLEKLLKTPIADENHISSAIPDETGPFWAGNPLIGETAPIY